MKFLEKLVNWARIKSPWIIHFNTGACNACDIEIVASLTPRFDLERFGVIIRGTPRHADVLVCSGPVTRQIKDRLIRIYEQMPEPKFVVAVGTCACSGGVFSGCYNIEGGIDSVIPVSAYIPGCPARPEAIIDGVVKLLSSLENPAPAAKPAGINDEDEDEAEHETEEAAPYLEVEITQKPAEQKVKEDPPQKEAPIQEEKAPQQVKSAPEKDEPAPEKPAPSGTEAKEANEEKEEQKTSEETTTPVKEEAEPPAAAVPAEPDKKHSKPDKIEAPWEKPKNGDTKPESNQEAANG